MPPVAKTRQNVEQWSNNNGTVIYAQSNVVKNSLNLDTRLDNRQKESHANSKVLNGSFLANETNKSTMMDPHKGIVNGNQTLSMENHHRLPDVDIKLDGGAKLSDDPANALNNCPVDPKWSNGTCTTSDLLF